jgi:hypothetical protein
MISRNLSLLAMVALFCMIFVGLTQTAPLNKRQAIAWADFPDDLGRTTFVPGSTHVFGQFNRGFKKDTNINNYEFIIVTKEEKNIDLTNGFRNKVKIYPDGSTAPFEINFKVNFVSNFVGCKFIIKHSGKIFAKALIKYN